jgi:XRE family transcriptional regulator, regulator of sulfur utilization
MEESMAERLATNIRQLREGRGLSQHQIAKLAEVPRPTWANLESGEANPTILVLSKVARALNVRVEDLIAPARLTARLSPAESLPSIRRGKVSIRNLLTTPIPGLELERMVFAPHAHLQAQPHERSTFEYLTCEVGALEVETGGASYALEAGDVLAFRADRPHAYRNRRAERAVAYAIVSLASDS